MFRVNHKIVHNLILSVQIIIFRSPSSWTRPSRVWALAPGPHHPLYHQPSSHHHLPCPTGVSPASWPQLHQNNVFPVPSQTRHVSPQLHTNQHTALTESKLWDNYSPSGSISSPSSTSSPAPSPDPNPVSLVNSLGKLKLVLRLELALPDLPDAGLPPLEIEVRREDGPEVSAPVDETGDEGGGESVIYLFPRWRSGISNRSYFIEEGRERRGNTDLLPLRPSRRCI